MKTTFKIFYLIILLSSLITAQKMQSSSEFGFPLIRNYLSKEYSANGQNWSIIQDKRGVMYFGNVDGVLEYDGVNWRLIPVPNGVVRCLALDENGVIFVAGINEIGYLLPDSTGLLKYISLNKHISKSDINFGDVWSLIVHNDGLYIQTFSSIFLLESNKNKKSSFLNRILKHPSLKRWESRTRFNPIHIVGGRIFVHERNIGLQELVNGSLTILPEGQKFAQDLICIMLPYQLQNVKSPQTNKILIGSLRRGMFLFDGNGFEKFDNQADNYLIENRLYYRGALLRDGTFALGTQLGGIVVIDQTGKWKSTFNKTAGLSNETVWDLYTDREGNLWAALDNGISKIFYPSSTRILTEKSGFEGSIHAINKFGGTIYLATSSGIYYFQKPHGNQTGKVFNPVKGISVQSWDLLTLNNILLAATNDGIFKIKNNISSIIDVNLRYTLCLLKSTSDSTIIYAGLQNGIAVLKNENNNLVNLGIIPNFQDGIEDIQEDSKGNLWLNDILGKIIRIKIPVNKTDLSGYKKEKISNELSLKLRSKLFKQQNQIYIYNSRNILTYDEVNNKFIPAIQFDNIFKDTTKKIIQLYNVDKTLWCVTNVDRKIQVLEAVPDNGAYLINRHSFLETIGEDFSSDFTLLNFFLDTSNGGKLWISGGNILVNYDIYTDKNYGPISEPKPLIRKVYTSNGNILFNGYEVSSGENIIETDIYYDQNSISFEFASPSFLNESGNDYQYKLEGFSSEWSNWTKETKKEYTNLSSGKFTFSIRSRNAVGDISPEASYSFRILPPWFKRWWANLIGFLIVLSMIYYVIRYRVKYLEKRNIILERMVNERTTKINEQNKTLEDQANKLKEMDQIKSNFFANISHEFRTPLTLIKGQIESLLEKSPGQDSKKKLNMALANSNRLHKLINQVLDLTKLESGTFNLEVEKTEIVSFIRNRVSAFESLAEQRKIELKNVSKIISQMILIDNEKIEEVIDNLLSNAFKFTNEGGKITVTTESEEIQSRKNILITVEDNGIGIPEEKLLKIFSRFFQVDSSSTKEQEGTGLGLAIVKEIIDLHAGTIDVQSKVNEGTKFSIRLPLEESVAQNIIETEESTTSEIDIKKDLILIVEDNIDVRGYIKENLQDHYNIAEAGNGEEGIDTAIKIIPDLIISDLMMPKVDGYQLCEKLKNDHRTSHIPIIMLTARADEKSKLDGLKTGADEYLSKPFSAKELILRVGNLIRIRQLLREKYREISILRPEEIKASSLDKEFVEKVFYIIKSHLEDSQFSVQLLADEIGMSVSQINRKLNALINQTAGKLIRSTKLEYAAKLIESKSGNISEVAYRIGFSDLSSFTNSFKEKYGVSPTDYLKSKDRDS